MTAAGGERLTRWVRSLGVPYGREPSVKLVRDRALDDRFLLTLSRADVPAADLLVQALSWNMPAGLESALVQGCEEADVIHLGWEGGPSGGMIKLYFERVKRLRADRERWKPGQPPVLIHEAIKWNESGEQGATARYTADPAQDPESMAARIQDLLRGGAAALALELLERAAGHAGAGALFFMEVEEADNPRRSFDLNLYRAGLTLEDLEDWISRTWRHFDAGPPGGIETSSGRSPDFGHLAAGTDRAGREFFSLYYGIERGA